MQKPILQLKNLKKNFSNSEILKGVSIDIYKGEFITLLGSSGCGKTTTLRAIAGFEMVDEGEIIINGKDVTHLEPNKRNVNTVFQSYALFPHMNVYDNIAYGPKIKKTDKAEINKSVTKMLELVQMEGYENRTPNQLSGGQRQRIAIARALVNKPDIVLLDEPLGALDLKLRQHMQSELRRIQKSINTTFIYVTHDQDEALNMSDRLAVMNEGVFEQIGTPEEIYQFPKTEFVAEFVGERNIFKSKIKNTNNNKICFEYDGMDFCAVSKDSFVVDEPIYIAIHSDRVNISNTKTKQNEIRGTVTETSYIGSQIKTFVNTNDANQFKITEYNKELTYKKGDTVYLSFDENNCIAIKDN